MLFYLSLAFDNPIAVITHTLAGHVFTVQNPERFTFTHSTRKRYKRNKVTRGPLSWPFKTVFISYRKRIICKKVKYPNISEIHRFVSST